MNSNPSPGPARVELANSQTMPSLQVDPKASTVSTSGEKANRLKLYGPLKINRSQIFIEERLQNTFHHGCKAPTLGRKKWTYFNDTDNKWNNPDWCNSEKVMEYYHNDRMKRDCIS